MNNYPTSTTTLTPGRSPREGLEQQNFATKGALDGYKPFHLEFLLTLPSQPQIILNLLIEPAFSRGIESD